MLRCPNCNSENYHIIVGYGAYCEDCAYAKDGEGDEVGIDGDGDRSRKQVVKGG